MVITNDDSVKDSRGDTDAEGMFSVTDTGDNTSSNNNQSDGGESNSGIQINTPALANEAVKAGVGALTAAVVTKKMIDSE